MAAASWRCSLLLLPPLLAACRELSLKRPEAFAGDTASQERSAGVSPRGENKGRSTDAAVESAEFGEIRRGLRRLAAAEETFFAENGSYTGDLSLMGFARDSKVRIRFLWLTPDGWAASGTTAALEGRDCVIYVGAAKAAPTTIKFVRSGSEGVPVCDDRSPARLPRAAAPESAAPSPAVPSRPDTANALDLLDPRIVMKVDLRNLARSQETYFAAQGSYARRTESLSLQYLWHQGVRLRILSAQAESWSAQATHAKLPGRSCVIWFGPVAQRPATAARGLQGSGSGVPVCDP